MVEQVDGKLIDVKNRISMKNTRDFKLVTIKYLKYSLLLVFGLFLGWLFFHPSKGDKTSNAISGEAIQSTTWTCAMHPQIKSPEPGKCPICGMDLVPLEKGASSETDPEAVQLSIEAVKLADVSTTVVSRQHPVKEIRLYGKVQTDERLLQSQVVHVSGRIEKLGVNFTGETVRKGQVLGKIYSPELVTAQQELLEAARTKLTQPSIYKAAREKLLQWKLTDNQISEIEESGIVQNTTDIISNCNGIVVARRVSSGDYVSQGTIIFDVADLSRVWILLDAYESDLAFLKKGEKVTFTIQSLPGREFSGSIVFIDPVIDATTRVAKVRVEAENGSGILKPEMFTTGIVSSSLNEYRNNVIIPRSAVLWTGKRSIVYVKLPGTEDPVFRLREIEIGPMLGEEYIVISGISEGEEIVTRGTFSVDAAAQLEGKPSMLNIVNDGTGKTVHATFHVSGKCEMCKERIEKAASSINGVKNGVWDIDTKEFSMDFNPEITDISTVQKAIARVGHDTELFRADDETYNKLPECCLYR